MKRKLDRVASPDSQFQDDRKSLNESSAEYFHVNAKSNETHLLSEPQILRSQGSQTLPR